MLTSNETVGFPVYGAAFDPDRRLIYVIGGGGSSKSGVKNLIVAYKMTAEDGGIKLAKVGETETGNGAPMNISVHNSLILCGVNDRCWMLEMDVVDESESVTMNLIKSFQTVEGPEEDPYQKIVKFSPDGSLFATSGSDGNIKVWKEGKRLFEIDSGEVSDLSFSPGSRRLYYVTNSILVSHDLEQKTSREIEKATKDFQLRSVLAFRSALLVVENSSDRAKSALIFRDAEGKTSRYSLPVKKAVTSIAADRDESLLAFGCADGTVGLFDVSSRKTIFLKHNLHSFAVTAVQITAQKDAKYMLISGSPDGNLKVTEGRFSGSSSLGIVILILLAFLVFVAASMIQKDPGCVHNFVLRIKSHLDL